MRRITNARFLFTVGLTILVCAGQTIPAQACSLTSKCETESACVEAALKDSSAVFVGRAVEVVLQHNEVKVNSRTYPVINYHVRFAVNEPFKGMTSPYVVSDNGSGDGDCSYGKMEVGQDYLIYANSVSKGSTYITLGFRTRPLEGPGLPASDLDELALLRRLASQPSRHHN